MFPIVKKLFPFTKNCGTIIKIHVVLKTGIGDGRKDWFKTDRF